MRPPHRLEFAGTEGNRLAADLFDGGGAPVLLLHGGGQTRRAWDKTARMLAAAGRRAISVDLRGHGESDWVESGDYRFSTYAADVAGLVRDVAQRFHVAPTVVGASLGGLSGLGAEIAYGPVLDSLVLVDVTPWMDQTGVDRIQGFMRSHISDGFATLEDAADAIAAYLPQRKRPRSLDGLAKNLRLGDDGRYRWHWDPRFLDGPLCVDADFEHWFARLRAGLPSLAIPTLLVRGLLSELIHEAEATAFLSATPGSRMVDVGGAGHMVAGDRNDAFSAAIIEFLTG